MHSHINGPHKLIKGRGGLVFYITNEPQQSPHLLKYRRARLKKAYRCITKHS